MKFSKPLAFAVFLLLSGHAIQAQQWQLDSEKAPGVSVAGTSTLTDWEVSCTEVLDVPAQISFNPPSGTIDNFSFKVPVKKMDGGRGASMNDKIVAAFQADEHPFIQFQQTAPSQITTNGNSYTIQSNGTLTMAGTSKSVTVNTTASIEGDKLVLKGNKELKMTDFDITPPSAMFGQIVTNDDIVVNFEFQYLKK